MNRLLVLVAILSLPAAALAADDPRAAVARGLAEARRQLGPMTVLWPAQAPAPRHLSGFHSAPVAGPPAVAARAFLRAHGAALGVDAARELRHVATVPTAAGPIVRFAQVVDGLPVYGASVTVALDAQGRAWLVNSSLRRAAGPLPAPRVSPAAARAAVAARGAVAGAARLMAVSAGGELRPCFVVYGRTLRPFGVWDYLVDARSGAVVRRLSRLHHVKGRVYEDSPAQGAGLIDADLGHLTATDTLTGDYADTWSATMSGWNSVSRQRRAVPVDGDYLYDPQEPSFTDPFAEVQMYYHVTRIHQWFVDTFGFSRTTRGGDQHIDTFVNFGTQSGGSVQAYDNAFYGDVDGDGRGDLTFGQGGLDFAYDAEVIYHEFTHSVVDEGPKLDGLDIDDLGLFLDPGSLNEAFADYFSSTYVGDPILGEYVGRELGPGGAIRQMTDPAGEHASCPDSLSGETHADGVVWARALWDTRELLGGAVADQTIWATLQSLNAGPSFSQAARSLIAVTRATLSDAAALYVGAALDARDLPGCSRIVPLADAEERTGTVMGQQTLGGIQVPHSLQYRIEVPEGAMRLKLSFQKQGYQGGTVKLIPYLRKDQPVGVIVDQSWKVTYQADITGQSGPPLIVNADDAEKPLVPGSAYYLLVTNDGEDDMFFHVDATITMTPPTPARPDAGAAPAPDAGAPDGDAPAAAAASASSGGCSAGGAARPAGALALLLLGLAAVRRRRP
jgi:MYXO-CTERM domain-containing protein